MRRKKGWRDGAMQGLVKQRSKRRVPDKRRHYWWLTGSKRAVATVSQLATMHKIQAFATWASASSRRLRYTTTQAPYTYLQGPEALVAQSGFCRIRSSKQTMLKTIDTQVGRRMVESQSNVDWDAGRPSRSTASLYIFTNSPLYLSRIF